VNDLDLVASGGAFVLLEPEIRSAPSGCWKRYALPGGLDAIP